MAEIKPIDWGKDQRKKAKLVQGIGLIGVFMIQDQRTGYTLSVQFDAKDEESIDKSVEYARKIIKERYEFRRDQLAKKGPTNGK